MDMQMPNDFKPKSFWERPEGTTGMIVSLLLLGGLGMVAYKLLPFIITLLQNALTATFLGVTLFAVLWVLFDKRFQNLVNHLFKSAMRKITQIFIEIDPIGILKNYVDHLKDQLSNMSKQITRLKGQIRALQESIQKNENDRVEALKLAKEARNQDMPQQYTLKARRAGRLEKSNLTLQQLLVKMELLYRVLQKMRTTAEIFIEDISDEVQVKERERNMIRASHSAMKSAMAIMRGDNDKSAIFQQTMEYLAEDYGRKLGEIEDFVSMSSGFMDSLDLQNGIFEADALLEIEAWEKKTDSLLLPPPEKQQIIFAAGNPGQLLDLDAEPVPVPRRRPSEGGEKKTWDDLVR